MVSLRQANGEDCRSNTKNGYLDPREILEVVAIQRNKHGQIYKVPDLNKSIHFSSDLALLEEIHHRIQFLSGRDLLPITVVPKSKLFHNTRGVFVRNVPSKSSGDSLSECKRLLQESVSEHNLLHNMKLISDGANRKSPCLSFGWTKTNAKLYKMTRTNMFQNTRPAIILGDFDNLSCHAKATLMLAIQNSLSLCPELNDAFKIPSNDSDRSEFCEIFSGMWLDSIKEYLHQDHYEYHNFNFEAFTVMIPLVLGPHRDKMNDFLKPMSNVVQINVSLPIQVLPDGPLKVCIKL